MEFVSGEILTSDGFQKGYIGFEKKKIVETGNLNPPKKPISKGLIVPSFVNAHTHIGDSFIREKNINLPNIIEKLVAPPDGLKHKLLRETSDEEVIKSMRNSIDIMIKTGTSFFCDFRESGIMGVCQLKSALRNWDISSVILSRPDDLVYTKNEIDILLKNSDGIGLSSLSDWEYSELEKVSKHVKKKNKIFALHASERIREDIDLILDLKPNFLIHMIKASESDFVRVKNEGVPVVICPRSNAFFGLKPKYELMKKVGINFLLGTDNMMLNSPSVLDELKYLKKECNEFSISDLFNKITYGARKALNLECDILGQDYPADFVVLDKQSLKTVYISK